MPEVTELLVLHTVRLTSVVEARVVAGRLDADDVVVEAVLDELRVQRFVQYRTGTLPGWALTAEGRARGEALLADELDRLGRRAAMEQAYDAFLELNQPVLQVCSDWQVVSSVEGLVLNDHGDPDYDRAVLDRLARLHDSASGALESAAAALDRFGHYRPRLANAVQRATAGEVDWVTKPMIDSFHTVWFELHEDLLATLGRQRADERDNDRNAVAPTDGGTARERDEDRR